MDDFARMSARIARRMRLRSMTEERIRETVVALSQSEQKQN